MRALIGRAALVGLGLVAMLAGVALGSSGCCRECPELDPVEPGMFEIVGSPLRPELIGGVVDASDDAVVISFDDADGNAWVVEYSIAYKTGG
jgi:hypothetical protein